MKNRLTIWNLALLLVLVPGRMPAQSADSPCLEFFGNTLCLPAQHQEYSELTLVPGRETVKDFYSYMESGDGKNIAAALVSYRQQQQLDDWIYYQLVRKVSEYLSPKAVNYHRYTLYKWYFLVKSGYDARLLAGADKLLFYVYSPDLIYNIPFRMEGDKQLVCLNYHDYNFSVDFEKEKFSEVSPVSPSSRPFNYQVKKLPDFKNDSYQEKEIQFSYYNENEKIRLKVNKDVQKLFQNYPTLDYRFQFNIPLSDETYHSLISGLKEKLKGMHVNHGVDYLMRFTRYAFLYERDIDRFGAEKRLSPEETLIYEQSDCEDRAALFFFLVKEIYDLPMLVLAYPGHVTVAVNLQKPVGEPIRYNGMLYTLCEPTPQKTDIRMGKLSPQLKNSSYEIAYEYIPGRKN